MPAGIIMLIPLKQTYSFISKEDKLLPENEKTLFLLRPLTVSEYSYVIALDLGTNQGSISYFKLSKCLLGWVNFKDSSGKQIEFSTENVNRLPLRIIKEIIEEIDKVSNLSDKIEKKIRFHVRWLHFTSENYIKTNDKWECNSCKDSNKQKERNCPLLDGDDSDDVSSSEKVISLEIAKSKYFLKGLKNQKNHSSDRIYKEFGGGFNLSYCPIPKLDHNIVNAISLVNWCEQVHTTPNGGIISEESNQYKSLRDIVVFENSKIQSEEMESTKRAMEQNNNNNKGGNVSNTRRRMPGPQRGLIKRNG